MATQAEYEDQAYQAASMYYVEGETMEVVAGHLGVSRSTVSRLLAWARANGIVRIEIEEPHGHTALEAEYQRTFGVRLHPVPVRRGVTDIRRLEHVAAVAADRLTAMMEPGTTLGVAWGRTVSEIATTLRSAPMPGSTVVQLNGASDITGEPPYAGEVLARIAEAFEARAVTFPVPAFFDRVEVREAMWTERSVQRVLAISRQAQVAVFGVGAVRTSLPSQVYQGDHLTPEDRRLMVHEGVVGDVCTVLLRADGSHRGITLNTRATGPTPEQLRRIPRRLCVVAGEGKARALLAALRAQVATDLVVDEPTAQAVLALQ